ncbi:MAG TPA: anti-sigma-F factor Fin family protein [Bacillales bacterium]|nr:anti-sigma-F factor Fin family protein [Bacillales bacterium]
MTITYRCQYCGTQIGRLQDEIYHAEQLGFNHLTVEERRELIHYSSNGDVVVTAICEDCQEALERNPDYHQLTTSFIQ